MNQSQSSAQWNLTEEGDHSVIHLSGSWNLLTRMRERHHLADGLGRLPHSEQWVWDLTGVQVIDSAGALLLWRIWNQHLPERFACPEAHRKWFERLAKVAVGSGRPKWSPWLVLVHLGVRLEEVAGDTIGMFILNGQLLLDFTWLLLHPRLMPWKEISASIYRTGATAIPLLGAVGFLIGTVMTMQLAMSLEKLGANTIIIQLLGLATLRELGPVITGIIVIGRTASTITAGIGVMHVTEEYDALRAFGISPTQRLILPNVIAMAISMPLLVIWSDFTQLIGGIMMADLRLGVGWQLFLQRLPETVPWVNFWIGMGKGMLFGMIIATVSSYFGLKIQPNTESLRRETTNAVVTCLALVLIIDASLGAMMTNIGLG